jgi:methylenetetrahydrofolate dehydrogenase (NADP+)/methenyltetrahydrofolate cyclohydrolase
MELLDGNVVKNKILDDLKIKLDKINKRLEFVIIEIGEDEDDLYLRQIFNMSSELNYKFKLIKLKSDIEEVEVVKVIKELNLNDDVDGISIKLPVPNHFDIQKIRNVIEYYKDVDGLTDINRIKLINNQKCLLPSCAAGVMEILKFYNIDIVGKNVVIVGRSDLVGKPLASLLLNNDATVTVAHSKTKNLGDITNKADILIMAIGSPKMITRDMIKDGVIVIDIGTSVLDGKLVGDVDYSGVLDKVSYITPVPRGVGAVTMAVFARNIYDAYVFKKSNSID